MSDETPAAKPAAKKPAAKNDEHPVAVEEHLAAAHEDSASLFGYSKVLLELETALVHALAGAEEKAKEAIATADAEIAKYAALAAGAANREFALLKAKIHAILSK